MFEQEGDHVNSLTCKFSPGWHKHKVCIVTLSGYCFWAVAHMATDTH